MTKKIIISLTVALFLFFILAAVIYLILKSKSDERVSSEVPVAKEETLEEKIRSVTAPERTGPLSEEELQRINKLLETVTAPEK